MFMSAHMVSEEDNMWCRTVWLV